MVVILVRDKIRDNIYCPTLTPTAKVLFIGTLLSD
jgi:hypothetical protein